MVISSDAGTAPVEPLDELSKAVVLTGAGSGIGAATAHRSAVEVATVVAVGRTARKLQKTATVGVGRRRILR
ncbi:hypothetical protein GCM10009608_70620 [Pseudonocardia alaniniphila]